MLHNRHFTLADQAADRYPRLGFDVEAGTGSFEVELRFDGDRAGIDLGCESPHGWRGWSGGARRSFVIGATEATPGYLPGPPEPGRWHVVLGLHRLPAEGVEVSVEIRFPATAVPDHGGAGEPRQVPRGSSRELPAPPGLAWYAGDFHAHSLHSDGSLGLEEVAALGVASGLDFLAITDHNTTSHHALLPELGRRLGITLLPGQEVTTHLGHANAFGDIGFVDFRTDPQTWLRTVAERGGVLSVNHPISGDCSWSWRGSARPPAVELWHSTWYSDPISTAPFAWFNQWERGSTLLGGSDFHNPADPVRPGCPTTWVAATGPSVAAILDGVRAGRTAITGSVRQVPGGFVPELLECPALVRVGGELVAVAAAGCVLVDGSGGREVVTGDRQRWAADPAGGPFRLVAADRSILALSA